MAGNDFHEQAAVFSRSAGIQIDKDKPGINEDEQSALDDTTELNDDSISSGNSTFCYSFYWLFWRAVQYCRTDSSRIPLPLIGKPEM